MSAARRAVVITSVAPMRAEPDARAEQVSQALLGESVDLLDEQAAFCRVRSGDGYAGWVRSARLRETGAGDRCPGGAGRIVTRLLAPVHGDASRRAPAIALLGMGSVVAVEPDGGPGAIQLPDGTNGWVSAGALGALPSVGPAAAQDAVRAALAFCGVPYLWGGRSAFGIDCSGLTQLSYRMAGVSLLRDAYLQAAMPELAAVAPGSAMAGDLVFFSSADDPLQRGITHVGMALDSGRMVHASAVRGVALGSFADPPNNRRIVCIRRVVHRPAGDL